MTARQRLLVIVVGMAGMVLAASAAFACANLVTINVSEHSATPGSTVTFRVDATRDDPAPDAEQPREVSDVVVRWNGHDGQELARGRSVNRTMSGSITIPDDVAPGRYMILANQTYTDTGVPVPGAPARTTIEVTAAQASGAAVSSQSTPSDTGAADAAPVAPAEEARAPSQPAAPAAPGAQSNSVPQESAATAPAAAPQPAAPTEGAAVSPRASAVSPSGAVTPSESGATAGSTRTGPVAAPQQLSPAVTSPTGVEQAARARFAAAERAAAAAGLHEVAASATSHPAAERAPAQAAATAPSPQTTWWSALPGSAAAGWAILALGLAMAAALLNRRRHGLGLAVGRLPL